MKHPANGRPVAAPTRRPICAACFRSRRRGAHWAPVLSCAFCMAFCGRAILLSRAADDRPYEKPHLCGSLPGTAVGAPIGRPSCPVHSAWPSAGGQFCFRGRPVAAPTRRPICAVCFPEHRRGAQWAPVLPCAFCMAFCGRAILLSAGGRWPPLREGQSVRLASRSTVGAPNGRPSCPVHSAWPSAGGQFCFRRAADGRPYAKANLCGLLPGAP